MKRRTVNIDDEWEVVFEAVSLAYDEPSEAHSALECIRDHINRLEARIAELEEALRTGIGPDPVEYCPAGHGDQCCGWHDACRAALQREEEKHES